MGEKREAASDKDVYFLYCNSNCYITHVFCTVYSCILFYVESQNFDF